MISFLLTESSFPTAFLKELRSCFNGLQIRCHSWSSSNTEAFKVDVTGPTLTGEVHGMSANTCRENQPLWIQLWIWWGCTTSGCSPKHLCKHLFNQPVLNLSGQHSAQPALFDLYKDELILNTPLQPWLQRSGEFRRAKKKEPVWSWGGKTDLLVCVCAWVNKTGPTFCSLST